jgi:hypothetical protein
VNGYAKQRIAVGVFHDITGLCEALDGLANIGCSADDVILLYDTGALDGQLDQKLADFIDNSTGSVRTLIRNSGEVGTERTEAKTAYSTLERDQILHFETWLPPRFGSDLDGHLRRGGCLLFCTGLSEAQEQIITKLLLQHSADPVQLHDLPAAG